MVLDFDQLIGKNPFARRLSHSLATYNSSHVCSYQVYAAALLRRTSKDLLFLDFFFSWTIPFSFLRDRFGNVFCYLCESSPFPSENFLRGLPAFSWTYFFLLNFSDSCLLQRC